VFRIKNNTYLIGGLIIVYLLGYYTRGVLNVEDASNELVMEQALFELHKKFKTKAPRSNIFEEEELSSENEPITYIDVPYDREDPIKRLQALEKLRYDLPGSAFTRLVDKTFNHNGNISASLSAIMELSIDEADKFNEILSETLNKISEIEAELCTEKLDNNGDVIFTIPSFPENGSQIRSELLENIKEKLGKDRSTIFEMVLLQKPSSFGNFGATSVVFKNPRFEIVNGRHKIVTIEIGKIVDAGTDDERFEGVRKAYNLEAFKKRFGLLFEIE
jgi:hypothetical protein